MLTQDPQINATLNSHIQRGRDILQSLDAETQKLHGPLADLEKSLMAAGAGALAVGLLGSKKARGHAKRLTRGVLDSEQKRIKDNITQAHYQLYMAWMAGVEAFLSGVSTTGPRIKAPGNSQTLVRNVRKAEGLQRLNSRIRRVLGELEGFRAKGLVWNASLPQPRPVLPKQLAPDSRETLYGLENMLRRRIEQRLSSLPGDWWSERIPSQVRGSTKNKKLRRKTVWPWDTGTSSSPIDYLDFSDYRKIILDPANWKDCFAGIFKNESFIENKLNELEPIRHDLAHSRTIEDNARDKLRIYAKDIENCIANSETERP